MNNIVRLTDKQVLNLIDDLTYARDNGRSVRICTEPDNDGGIWIKWDAGCGWTPPFYGQDW